jgi:hypothetical protein
VSEKLPAQPKSGPIPKITRIAAGPPHCTLHEDNSVRCWDYHGTDALPIPKAAGTKAIDAGNNFGACGLRKSDGSAWCMDAWSNSVAFEVRDVCGVNAATDISVGQQTACAVLDNGHVRCWPRKEQAFSPCDAGGKPAVEIAGLADATSIEVGAFDACAIRKDGSVACWELCGKDCASGVAGQVDPNVAPKATPVKGLANAKQLVYSYQPCALVGDDHVKCAAVKTAKASDTKLPEPVKRLSVGLGGICALTTKGHLFCWHGEPPVPAGDGLFDFAGDISDLCGVNEKNEIMCWGGMSGSEPPHVVALTY